MFAQIVGGVHHFEPCLGKLQGNLQYANAETRYY